MQYIRYKLLNTLLLSTQFIKEINVYIYYYLLSIFTTFIVVYYYIEQILKIISLPIIELDLISYFVYTNIDEIFVTYIYITIMVSLILSINNIIIYTYIYIKPGLYIIENRYIKKIISIILLSSSIYMYNIEEIIHISFNIIYYIYDINMLFNIELQPKSNEYFHLMVGLLFLFYIVSYIIISLFFFFVRNNGNYNRYNIIYIAICILIISLNVVISIKFILIITFIYESTLFIVILYNAYNIYMYNKNVIIIDNIIFNYRFKDYHF